MNQVISASILSADFANLGSEIRLCETAGVDWIHIDVMDGHFVPNLTLGPVIVEACRRITSLPLDCHLMIEEPESLVNAFVKAGATYITIHPEENPNIQQTLAAIRDSGCHPGVALNPATPVSTLEPLLHLVDMVLIMTVNPGFSGQVFMPETMEKIIATLRLIDASDRIIRLEVDGGISADNIKLVANSGADTFVSASSIFKSPLGIHSAVSQLREALK